MKDIFRKDLNLTYNPLGFFFLFLLSNGFLTFTSFSTVLRIWVFLLGLLLPLLGVCLVFTPPSAQSKPSFQWEPFKSFSFPRWAWGLLGMAALLPRFWWLGNPGWWPVPDDAVIARYILDLDHHWHWRVFEMVSQVSSWPSYFGWLVFKITGSILIAVQFPPIFFSSAALLVSYSTARIFFPKSISFIFFIFFAFSYWPLLMAKPLFAASLMPFLELLVFYALGRWLNSNRSFWIFALGTAAGLGIYTFPSWPAMWLWLAGLYLCFRRKKSARKFSGWLFLAGFLPALFPFGLAVWRQGYGGHLAAVAFWSGSSLWWTQTKIVLDYLQVLFWGGPSGLWMPLGGGFLNGLFDSFFFLGIIELYRHRRTNLFFLLSSSFILFLLPGFLAQGVETCRILLVLPLLLIIAAIGLNALLGVVPAARRPLVLALTLILGCAWDILRIVPSAPSSSLSNGIRTFNERQISYETLKPIADQKGPGLIFSEMVPFTTDNSLLVCSYPFNAALNPSLDSQKVSWAVVFTDRNYVPALHKRFPLSRWKDLSPSPATVPGLYQLGLIPLTEKNRPLFDQWKNYYTAVQQIDFNYFDTPTGQPETRVLQGLLDFYPSVPEDSFLQSCFFEKLAHYYSFEKTFYPQDRWTDCKNFKDVFRRSFSKSLQDVALCEKYGQILEISGEPIEARKMFEKVFQLTYQNKSIHQDLK
jgi:hypothetical protein